MIRRVRIGLIVWLALAKLMVSAVYAQDELQSSKDKTQLAKLSSDLLIDSSTFELDLISQPAPGGKNDIPEAQNTDHDALVLIESSDFSLDRIDVQQESNRTKYPTSINTPDVSSLSIKAAVIGLPKEFFTHFITDSEIVGMTILGSQSDMHTATTGDLDVALSSEFERYMPLVRLLKGFHVRANREGGRLIFQADFSPPVIFDIESGEINIDGAAQQVDFIAGISDITQTREIYLPVDVVAQIFNFRIEWSEEQYEYVAHTDNVLSMWKRKAPSSSKGVELIPADLPQAHAPARPSTSLVSLMETRMNYQMSSGLNGEVPEASLSLSETIYGHLFGGRYHVSFSQPSLVINEAGGLTASDTEATLPRRIEWTKEIGENSQMFLGDTNFNLNDLAMPFVNNMTGLRVSGLVGEGSEEIAGIPQFSLTNSFLQTNDYSGLARLGSEVKLIVNENEVATAPVLDEPDLPNGYGRYEFFDVSIPGGSLVDIRIEIHEPDGTLIELDKSTVNADRLVGDGQIAYLGGIGTRRDLQEWGAQGILGGARLLYGVTPTLTLGLTAAYQDEYFNTNESSSEFRSVAKTSGHLASEFAWLAHNKLLLSGDLALSTGDETSEGISYDGTAMRLRSDWYPMRDFDLSSQLYRYSPGFFDGQNDELEDRQGINISSRWKYRDWFRIRTSLGQVADNLDGDRDVTREASYQSFEISSNLIPNTQLRLKADQITPDQGEDQTNFTIGAGYGNYGFSLRGEISEPTGRLENEYALLLRGINATGVDLYPTQTKSVSINKTLFGRHKFGISWIDSQFRQGNSYTFSHRWSGNSLFGLTKILPLGDDQHSFDIFNEYHSESVEDRLSSRINVYLDARRRNRLGLTLDYGFERGWRLSASLNLTNLFWMDDKIESISGYRVNPGGSAIKGKVFYDANGNTVMDPGEEGIPDIAVLSQGRKVGSTDKKGNFLLSTRYGETEASVYLDIDSVPALLSPTHALQTAYTAKGAFTEINFGLAPVISLSGILLGQDENKNDHNPISGVRVFLFNQEGELIKESITAPDGSYFLEAMPGNYSIKVDTATVEGKYVLSESARNLIVTGKEEYQEMELTPLVAKLMSPGEMMRAKGDGSAPEWGLDIPLLENSFELSESRDADQIKIQTLPEIELINDEMEFELQ